MRSRSIQAERIPTPRAQMRRSRRRFGLLIALLCSAVPAFSHPGVSIVIDSRGIVYYTDLEHVWRILPDGSKEIAVRRVHTHELYLDDDDYLYGEDVVYEGERLDTWRSRV